MKALKLYLIISLLVIAAISQKVYAANITVKKDGAGQGQENGAVRKLEIAIAADRDKIIQENAAIKENMRKIKESEKIADAAKAAEMKEELERDIEKRKNAIKELKKDQNIFCPKLPENKLYLQFHLFLFLVPPSLKQLLSN